MMLRRMLATIALTALAACGSATDSITFQAPPGYTQAASIGPFLQVWRTSDTQNLITLFALPTKIDLDRAMSQSDIKDAEVKSKGAITICGSQPAVFADIVGESKSTGGETPHRMRIEFIATNANDKTYMAMYLRPVDAAANPAAEAAIRKICPKS
jgi:hypothetical protein